MHAALAVPVHHGSSGARRRQMDLEQRRLIWREERAQLACRQCCQRCGTWTGWTRLPCRWMGCTGALPLPAKKELHALHKQHGLSVIVFVDCLLESLQLYNTCNVRKKELPALSWPGHYLIRAQPAFLASSFQSAMQCTQGAAMHSRALLGPS